MGTGAIYVWRTAGGTRDEDRQPRCREPAAARSAEAVAASDSNTTNDPHNYSPEPVPYEVVSELVALSTHAPSACNRRGWRFILIDDAGSLQWLTRQGGSSVLQRSRQVLLVCYRDDTDNTAWRDVDQSAAAAIAYFQLLAHTRGIGSCWICHLPPQREIRRRFRIPPPYRPIAGMTFGYLCDDTRVRPRQLPPEAPLCRNTWEFTDPPEPFVNRFRRRCRWLARTLFFLCPGRRLIRSAVEPWQRKFNHEDPEA